MILDKQKIEFTYQEASGLWAVIDNFLTAEIPEGIRIRILDLLARKLLAQVAAKLWSNSLRHSPHKKLIKLTFSPEQIIAIYSCIQINYPGPSAVAHGKFQQKALNYDQFVQIGKT